MSSRTVEAVLRLSSKLGSMRAFGQLSGHLDKVDRKAKAFNRTQSVMAASTSRAIASTARFVTAGAMAYGIKGSIVAYAAVERRLNRIAINADKGRDSVDAMLKVVNQTSHDYAMSQDEVTAGLETLVAAGRSAEDAMAFLPSVTATAQAAGAEIADMATTADAVGTSLGITADQMQHAFDILVTAGKQGKFELRDMAQYLPSMAPAFAALGYRGEKGLAKLAAMLQVIRQRTGSAGEAATAAQNIFQKMESDETVKKFAKFGVDLRKEMSRARKEGRDLVDVFLDLSNKATKGDLSKIPQLFTDAQFQVGMRALLMGREELEKFNRGLSDVDGSTLEALGQVIGDNQAKIDRMASSWERLKLSFGSAVSDPVSSIIDKVSNQLDFDSALDAGYAKRGLSGWKRAKDQLFSSQEELRRIAFDGGWRSEEGKKAEAGKMELSPELPSRRRNAEGPSPLQDEVATGRPGNRKRKSGFEVLPQTVAVPLPRSNPGMVLPDLEYNRFPPRSPEGMRRAIEADRRAATAKIIDGSSTGLRGAMMGDGGHADDDLRQAGDDAGRSISEAAEAINRAGEQGGSTFARMLEGLGSRIGQEAAAAFNANVKTVSVALPRNNGHNPPSIVSGDFGRSMPNAGGGQLASGNMGRSMPNAGRNY